MIVQLKVLIDYEIINLAIVVVFIKEVIEYDIVYIVLIVNLILNHVSKDVSLHQIPINKILITDVGFDIDHIFSFHLYSIALNVR